MAKPRFTWRKEPSERGLARVCQSPRGVELFYGGIKVGYVKPPNPYNPRAGAQRYWFCIGSNDLKIPSFNSLWAHKDYATLEEAKETCKTFVVEALKNAQAQAPGDGPGR